MEREFPLRMVKEKEGKVLLGWDDGGITVQAELPVRREGLCKLCLHGEGGQLLIGTLIPEGGRLLLRRRISRREAERAGVWPPSGVSAALVWPFRSERPFPRPDLFCFGRVEEGRLWLRFDGEGNPVMPE